MSLVHESRLIECANVPVFTTDSYPD